MTLGRRMSRRQNSVAARPVRISVPGSGTTCTSPIRTVPVPLGTLEKKCVVGVAAASVHSVALAPSTAYSPNKPDAVDDAENVVCNSKAPRAVGTSVPAATESKSLADRVALPFVTLRPVNEPGNTYPGGNGEFVLVVGLANVNDPVAPASGTITSENCHAVMKFVGASGLMLLTTLIDSGPEVVPGPSMSGVPGGALVASVITSARPVTDRLNAKTALDRYLHGARPSRLKS